MESETGRRHDDLMEANPYYKSLFGEFSFAVQKVMSELSRRDEGDGFAVSEDIQASASTALRVSMHPQVFSKARNLLDEMYGIYKSAPVQGRQPTLAA
ncbi:MAG: hypothetical protein ACK4NR_06055 [Micavibrio sp.]